MAYQALVHTGTTEQAFAFYSLLFGTECSGPIMRFRDIPDAARSAAAGRTGPRGRGRLAARHAPAIGR